MKKFKNLLESDWKNLNEKLKQGFNDVKSLIPEFEKDTFQMGITGPYFNKGFNQKIKDSEKIRLRMLELLKKKSKVDRSEFHKLKKLESKTKVVIKLLDIISIFNPDRDFHKSYKKLKIKFHKEKKLLKKIWDESEKDNKIDSELLELFSSISYMLGEFFEDCYMALDKNTHRKEPYKLFIVIREFQDFLKEVHKKLSEIVSDDKEIRNELRAIGSVMHFLSGEIENEDDFFKNLDKDKGKGNKKIEKLLSGIIKRTIVTEEEINSVIKEVK